MEPLPIHLNRADHVRATIFNLPELLSKVAVWRLQSDNIVFTNGCFDILHPGHVDYLLQASALGNRLIVAVNADASVRALKGPTRPLNSETDRAFLIASLKFVDAVVIFSEDTPEALIEQIQPDVLVKGSDYNALETNPSSPKYIVGSDLVRQKGGLVATIPLLDGYSTTYLIDRIRKHG